VLAASVPIAATHQRLIDASGLGEDLNVGPALTPRVKGEAPVGGMPA